MKTLYPVGLVLLVAFSSCHRRPPTDTTQGQRPAPNRAGMPASESPPSAERLDAAPPSPPEFAVDAVATQDGDAFWYDVPEQSLPQRKAWPQELTAASDTLPQNSYVRVRRLDGKAAPVVVRITDDGVHRKGALVDVNRAAAEALGIVKIGTIRVRVETLALKHASADKPVEKKDEPAAPKLTGTPAVSQQAEKDAANAKTGGQSAP